ncbi:ATP-binding protein [Pedobacter cryoconitis]|uniref:ATP-binding protein n=1 Tax=Pedobacter cryoconitis TaxID=188932 RepID=A0A127V8F6_9SPHI|nr:ATP-binding protein [Pedobacter cryoconitis]AMP97672.1 ATP-binding protein [Pedobacter cryoconitis]
MIVSFSITNFRSIKDTVTLSFEADKSQDLEKYFILEPAPGQRLLKLGLIYGANGSGKTTILKALDSLRTLIVSSPLQKQTTLNYTPFLFNALTSAQETKFELIFFQNGIKYSYEIAFTKEAITFEKLEFYSPNKSLIYKRETNIEKQLTEIKFGTKAKLKRTQEEILEANTLWNNPVLSGFLKSNIDSPELRDVTDWFDKVLRKLITPKTDLSDSINKAIENKEINKDHIIKFLQKADFKITDLALEKRTIDYDDDMRKIMRFINKQIASRTPSSSSEKDPESLDLLEIGFRHSVLNGDHSDSYILPYAQESEGTQRYFQFSGLLDQILGKSSVILIDELESSLHPELLKHFLLLFLVNVKGSQIIATTHYRELLMERDIFRDDAIWFTEKISDGSIELYALSDFDSSVIRDTTSVFNAYKSGKLGAVPQLEDYYLDFDNES